MKLGLALKQVQEAEADLASELLKIGDRHAADQEIHHTTHRLAEGCAVLIERLRPFGERYEIDLDEVEGGSPGLLGPPPGRLDQRSRGPHLVVQPKRDTCRFFRGNRLKRRLCRRRRPWQHDLWGKRVVNNLRRILGWRPGSLADCVDRCKNDRQKEARC